MNQLEFFDMFEDSQWEVQRQISHSKGIQYLFSGSAMFEKLDAIRLLYTEQGICKGGGRKFEARRSYIYSKESDFQIDVQFADESSFYSIRCIELPMIEVDHLCDRDLYLGQLEYRASEIRLRWRVKGPQKDYYSASLLIPSNCVAGLTNGEPIANV